MSLLREIGYASAAILKTLVGPMLGKDELIDSVGYVVSNGPPTSVVPDFIGQHLYDSSTPTWYKAHGVAAGQWTLSGVPSNVVLAQTDPVTGGITLSAAGSSTNGVGGVVVAAATGVPETDAAAIVAAITQAGDGGVVEFPPRNTYRVGGKGATCYVRNILPSQIIGNGSTIKLSDAQASTTLNLGVDLDITHPTPAGGRQIIGVADASKFAVGDFVYFCDASYSAGTNGNYTNDTQITAVDVNANTIEVATVRFASGSSINKTTGLCIQEDRGLAISMSSAARHIEVRGLVFDGNIDTRKASANFRHQWNVGQLLAIIGDVSIASVWIDKCEFKNHATDAFNGIRVPQLKVTGCVFDNIWGNGIHPGGTVATVDCIYEGNTFNNVQQFPGLYAAGTKYYTGEYVISSGGHLFRSAQYTTGNTPTDPAGDAYWTAVETGYVMPTADQYGHTSGIGAMVTSTGPVRGVCANNIVNGSRGYGFSAVNTTDTDWTISGNVFKSCDQGAIHCMGGGGSFTGNLIKNCGHEAKHTTNNPETAGISVGTGAPAQVSISGNTLIDSGIAVIGNASDVTISGNYISGLNLLNTTGNTNARLLQMVTISGGKRINVNGNVIALPIQSDHALNGLAITSGVDSVKISDNIIDGGRFGVYIGNYAHNAISFTGNVISGQWNSTASGVNHARGIIGQTIAGVVTGLDISGNTLANYATDTSGGYKAIDMFTTGLTAKGIRIADNNIVIKSRTSDVGIAIGAGYDGANIQIVDNYVLTAGGAPLTMAAAQAATMHIRGNRLAGGTSTAISGATIAYAADSNVYT
jgi:hypothetical protein